MKRALRQHWPEYLMEAAELGIFMVSAGVFAVLLDYPQSPVHRAISSPFLRLVLTGIAMGLTALGIFYSPWGKRSGAHMNPAVTLAFYRLGKVEPWDAFFYILFQCLGGVAGVLLVKGIVGKAFTDLPVHYVVTMPGKAGVAWALTAEVVIAFGMMTMVLVTSNHARWSRHTSKIAALLVTSYIITTGPVSGFSMNPARTLASALPANSWTAFWIYLVAPISGMLAAAQVYRSFASGVICAKFHHHNDERCIFRCGYCNHQTVEEQPLVKEKLQPSH